MAACLKPVLFLVACLIAGLPASLHAAEDGPSAEQRADWDARLAAAKDRQRAGAAAQKEIQATFEADKVACFKKFRVSDCQNDAKQRYAASMREAREVENEGKEAERRVRREELADRQARVAREEARKSAEMPNRAAEIRNERGAAAQARSDRVAGKEAEARKGKARREADAARLSEKRRKHEQKVAERIEKARRHESPTAR